MVSELHDTESEEELCWGERERERSKLDMRNRGKQRVAETHLDGCDSGSGVTEGGCGQYLWLHGDFLSQTVVAKWWCCD